MVNMISVTWVKESTFFAQFIIIRSRTHFKKKLFYRVYKGYLTLLKLITIRGGRCFDSGQFEENFKRSIKELLHQSKLLKAR